MKTQLQIACLATIVATASLSAQNTKILFIGGQVGPTQGADATVMTYLEDRYGAANITYKQAGATLAGEERAFDALIISSTPNSGDMRNKFHNSSTPVLNWEEAIADNGGGEFRITGGRTKDNVATDHVISIVEEHQITAGFAIGQEVTISTGQTEVWWSTGQQAPGSLSLATELEDSNRLFMTIVETDGELNDGTLARARRVMMGMTDSTFNLFTDDGKLLFGQSVDWILGLSVDRFQLTEVSLNAGMLSISWESQLGKIYNLRSETDPAASEPASWPIFSGKMDISANPPENTLTIPLPAESDRLFVIEEFDPPPVSIYSEDFEMGQGSWEAGPAGAVRSFWEFDTPSGVGPSGANSGSNCFGTNIDANYTDNASIWLRSPVIDLTAAAGATLNFFQFTDIEFVFDSGTVNVLAADNSFLAEVVTGIDGDGLDGWKMFSKKMPTAALGNMIKLEFLFTSDELNDFPHAGWYIDDVEVTVP